MNPCHSSDYSFKDEQALISGTIASPSFFLPLISSQLGLIHSFRQPSGHRPKLPETNNFVQNLGKNVSSNVDRCLKMVQDFVFRSGFLDKIMSIRLNPQIGFQFHGSQNGALMRNLNFAAILPGDSVAGMVAANGVLNFLNIYNTLLIVRLVLTWFPNAPPAIVSPLSTLCDPYLNIFRGLIPPLGGTLDLSPILAFLVLNAFTSTAAALPAELPPSIDNNSPSYSQGNVTHLTSSQKKWITRLSGENRMKPGGGAI